MKLVNLIENPETWQDNYLQEGNAPLAVIETLSLSRAEGSIGIEALYRIASVKSPRRAELTKRNSEGLVRGVTRLAFDKNVVVSERARIALLTSLEGVRVPTASAVLSWVFPEEWPVIDRRAWASLAHFGFTNPRAGARLTDLHWQQYCDLVFPCAEQLGWTPQKVDRWLYGYARDHGLGGAK
jgi:hypothetical protein